MIAETRTNLFQSSDGFSVEIIGFSRLRYTENDRTTLIYSETLNGPEGMAVYKESIEKWDPPFSGGTITDADRNRIIENIREVFRFMGFEILVM